jgi:RNA polymerase sigma-70 factor (ECF subfamily)
VVPSIARFRGTSGQLRSYLFSIATNVLRDHRRQNPLHEELPEDVEAPAHAPPEARLDLDRVLVAIHALPSPAREVLLLHFVEDMTMAEVGETLSLPLNTVKSHIHRSRTHLRALFQEYATEGSRHEKQ